MNKTTPPDGSAEIESEQELARRRDEVVKRMLATPPQPKKSKQAKPKA